MPAAAFDPFESSAALIVYVDFKSPYAYLAKDPVYTIADELGIAVDWRPLTLDIPSYLGSARLDDKGKVVESERTPAQWAGVRYAYRDAKRYASLRHIRLLGTTKIWDSSLAGIGMTWAKMQGDAVLRGYLDRTYERFWKRELDIEQLDVVTGVLSEAGADVSGFTDYATGPGRVEHDATQLAIFEAGIFGVPSFIVPSVGSDDFFWGREHLPMVRWLLSGKRGPAPDIAYRHFAPLASS